MENMNSQPAICSPAIINAITKRIFVRGMRLDGEFQCRIVKYITSGAVKIVNQYINMESVATASAMLS